MNGLVATESQPRTGEVDPEVAPPALTAALQYLTRGWTPMPVRGKVPLVEWKPLQDTPPTESQLREWWTEWPDADVGLVTGARSGLVVLDLDGAEGKHAVVARAGSAMPRTPVAQTRRGWHLYFRHPGGIVNNRAGLLPHVDVGGDGGFVVAPPSIHANGRAYKWYFAPDTPLADLPAWLQDLIRAPDATQSPTPGFTAPDEIPEGKRDDTLWRIARSLRHKGLDREAIAAAIRVENAKKCRPPLPEPELTDLLDHAWAQPDRPEFVFVPSPTESRPNESNDGSRVIESPHTARRGQFEPISAADLLEKEAEPVTWIWEPYLPVASLALLSAFPKVGKSTLMAALVVAVAQGRPFLGTPTRRVPVLVLAVEEHRRDVRRRLAKFGLTRHDPVQVHVGALEPGQLEAIARAVRTQRVGLVVLDTLTTYWTTKDENDNAEVKRQVLPLLEFARTTNAAVLLVHHETKKGGRRGRGVRGGSALLGLADQALVLSAGTPKQGLTENQRFLESVGRYEESPKCVVLELDGNEYSIRGQASGDVTAARHATLLAALSELPQTVEQLVEVSGLGEGLVRELLKSMEAEVTKHGAGVRGDPVRYARRASDSIPSPALPGVKTNSELAAVQSGPPGPDCTPLNWAPGRRPHETARTLPSR